MCHPIQREAYQDNIDSKMKAMYKLDDSPSHFKQPAFYLRQLRQNGDYRLCDIELLTDAGSENIHSAVAAAHCKKIAKIMETRSTPLRIDVRGFRPDLVMKVVEWMYNGEIEMPTDNMVDNMSITNYLGMVVLHHLFENTLRNMANEASTRIEAINVATHPKTGVSPETLSYLLGVIYARHSTFSNEEIMLLQPWATKTLVATPVRTPTKIALLNTVLNWLRDEHNSRFIDVIVSNISVQDMSVRELAAFQRTLRTVLLNPSTRKLVSTSVDENGIISINMDRRNFIHHAGLAAGRDASSSIESRSSRSESGGSQFRPLIMHEQNRDLSQSYMSDLPSYTETASPSVQLDDLRSSEEPLLSSKITRRPRLNNHSQRLARSPSIFPSNRDRRLQYTQSEIEELNSYPENTFTRIKPASQVGRYTSSELEELENIPADIFCRDNTRSAVICAANMPENSQNIGSVAVDPPSRSNNGEVPLAPPNRLATGPSDAGPRYIASHYAF
ncbi:BTB/POZ domain protein [Trichostrongylus colubriformis]|uniref:BTB/POZ domain protein n=1 Tax=Trichostrongylus colubriformis TaxID=6319 RepID=A0AAN8FIL1_TRICO